MATTKIATTKLLNQDDFYIVNNQTGEVVKAEKVKVTTTNKDVVKIDYDDFIVLNQHAMEYIKTYCIPDGGTNMQDVSRILEIGCTIQANRKFPIAMQAENTPHTTASLRQMLGINQPNFSKMLQRLTYDNILIYAVTYKSGFKQKVYLLNPYVAKKAGIIDVDVVSSCFFKSIPDLIIDRIKKREQRRLEKMQEEFNTKFIESN